MITSVVQNMMTKIMKELLWRQVWWNMSIARKYSHICHGYNVDQLDPVAIFNYQVDNPPFTVYHFVAHMVVLRNALLWERYRRHRHRIFTARPQVSATVNRSDLWIVLNLKKTSSKPK